ncbi:MAG: gamma-glutamyltransferase family protein [Vicinamibacterales bacterium]
MATLTTARTSVARFARAGLIAIAIAAVASGSAGQGRQAPGFVSSPVDAGRRVEGANGVVASANVLASEAGIEMLEAGGNAVDAAVATAFAIGVVEPQMSGLGGSGVANVWLQREKRPIYLDFYAAQPVDAWRGHTEPAEAQPAPEAAPGQEPASPARKPGDLRVVAIPGEVAGLLTLHGKYGKLPLATVMAPAIRLAEEGFPVGQILAGFIAGSEAKLKPFPEAHGLMFPGGKALQPGEILRNPALAESLRRIATHGRKGFYEGPTAEALVATLKAGGHPARLEDLRAFEPQWRRPLCTDYRGYTVLSAPPPESGMQVLHALELLEPLDLKGLGLPTRSAAAFDALVTAMRAGQSVSRANGDPNWVEVPARGITSEAFAATRRALIGAPKPPAAMEPADARPFDNASPPGACGLYDPYPPAPVVRNPTVAAGGPPSGDVAGERGGEDEGETTHLSVVDKDGNAVALTQTNSSVFGSGGFVAGFFLNDSGFRFSNQTIDAPSNSRWRIRQTTISPTIVLKGTEVDLVIGAPGGGRIPTEVLQVMVYMLDYGLDPLDAVRMPRIFPSAGNTRVQLAHGFPPEVLKDIRERGYEVLAESEGYARLYLVKRAGGVWVGVSDPLHDGRPRAY